MRRPLSRLMGDATPPTPSRTQGFSSLACQMPEQAQDATAMAISGGGALAAAAARGLARAALGCSCSKVAQHLAGAWGELRGWHPGRLAAAAARERTRTCAGLASQARFLCGRTLLPPAGAALSLEAGPSFADDLQAALEAAGSSLPACAVPSQLAG